MSLKSKIAIALGVATAIGGTAILLIFLLSGRAGQAPGAGGPAETARAAPGAEPIGDDSSIEEIDAEPAEEEGSPKAPRAAGAPVPAGGGWTITGRVVRIAEDGSPPAPMAGVAITLVGHPRRVKPEDAPPPAKRVTGPDGLFLFEAVPGIYMQMVIDEPSSALRTLSFELKDPTGDRLRDMGDVPLEAGHTVAIRLVGPADEPVRKGKLLVGRRSATAAGNLSDKGFHESRREGKEKGDGDYILERAPGGALYVQITAPGYAPQEVQFENPLAEPLVVRLEKGFTIAGIVRSSEGEPIAGAEVEVEDSSPSVKGGSDKEGRFLIDSVGPGNHELTARADGFVSTTKSIEAGAEDAEFVLAREAVFAGKVIAEDGEAPVEGARVTIRSVDRRSSHSSTTDKGGAFRIPKLRAGAYTAIADHLEFAPSLETSRELAAGEKVEDEVFRLPRGFVATGKVVDVASGSGIADAQVTFELRSGENTAGAPKMAKSGPDGAFEVKGLRDGSYNLTASAKGYMAPKPRTVSVAAGGETEFEVTLERGGSISGIVLDDRDAPVANATMRLNASLPDDRSGMDLDAVQELVLGSSQVRTDAGGIYIIEGLPAFKGYVVQVNHKDFAAAKSPGIAVGEGEAVEGVDFKLARGGAIRGRVLDEKGNGIAGANVYAMVERGREGEAEDRTFISYNDRTATSDAQGNYSLEHISPGTFTVRAQARDRIAARREGVAVAEGRMAEGIDLVLGEGETISGRVVDEDGNPISRAQVQAYGGETNASARTDGEGRFELKGLSPGQNHVNAWMQDYQGQEVQVNVPAKEEVVLRLERTARISGTVRAEGKASFSNFQIMAISQGENRSIRSMNGGNSDGSFQINLQEGTYILRAIVPGFAPSDSPPITLRKGERKEGIVIDLLPGATVRGIVTVKGTGEAVEGAHVTYQEAQVREEMRWVGNRGGANTDAGGAFVLEGLPEGEVTIVATHPRFTQARVPGLAVAIGRTAEVRIEMGTGGGIRGVVTRGGQAAAGASVHAMQMVRTAVDGNRESKNATTDAEGRFEILGLPAGEYVLSINFRSRGGGGGSSTRRTVIVTDDQVSEVEVTEAAGVTVRGTVLAGGQPVAGGMIQAAQPERGWDGGHGQIDGSGRYEIEVPGPGNYFFLVMAGERGGNRGTKITVKVPEGSPLVEQDIVLPSGEIAGSVSDAETGAAVSGAQVIAFAAGSPMRSLSSLYDKVQALVMTDAEGRFVMTAVPSGTYDLQVMGRGYAVRRVEGVAVDERRAPREVAVALEKGISFIVKVTDGKDGPIGGAIGFLRGSRGELVFTEQMAARSREDGTMEIRGVSAGDYELMVQHASFAPARIQVRAAADAPPITIALRPGGKVRIGVTDRGGRAVEGARLILRDARGEDVVEDLISMEGPRGPVVTGGDGTVNLGPVEPGSYRASATKDGARSREERVRVEEGETAQVTLRIGE